MTFIPAGTDHNCDYISELQLSEEVPLSCLFQSCATIIPFPHIHLHRSRCVFLWELAECVCDYPCCYQQRASIHSNRNERFSFVTKQFLCFHGAMILSKSQRKQRGGEKKNQCPLNPPVISRHLNLAGHGHVSTHASTCILSWRQNPHQNMLLLCLFTLSD